MSGKRIAKTLLVAPLCLLLLWSTVACGNTARTNSTIKAPPAQQVYRWAFGLPDIDTFDPGIATDNPSIQAINLVFTGLVQLDNRLQVRPQLAQSLPELSSDGLTYTFHLRPDLKFSDGTPLTASDVAYSIDRSLSPPINNQSGVALTYLGLIKGAADRVSGKSGSVIGSGVIVKDPATLEIRVERATAYFLGALSYPTSYVVERSVIEKWGDKWTDHLSDNGGQGGAGPFVVKNYDHITGIKFVPNSHYYEARPQLNEIDYQPYKDAQTSYNAYLAGQVDYTGIPVAQYSSVKGRRDFSQNPALTIGYLGLNYRVKPLNNLQIRQALSMALNREAINKAAFSSSYIPSCHIVPAGMYGYNPDLHCAGDVPLKGDAVRARQIFEQGLKEAGVSRDAFSNITLTYPSKNPVAANQVTTMQQMWKQALGIQFAPTTISQNALFNAISQTTGKDGPLQAYISLWGADFPDPQDWITLQFGANQPYNSVNFGDNDSVVVAQQKALQQRMEIADSMTNRDERARTYNQIEQQLVNDVSWASIYQRPDQRLLSPKIHGLVFNAFSQFPPNDWSNVYVTQ